MKRITLLEKITIGVSAGMLALASAPGLAHIIDTHKGQIVDEAAYVEEEQKVPEPTPEPETKEAVVSWYGEPFHSRTTASGRVFDQNELTCAHKTLPFGTKVALRAKETGKAVVVEVTDRGPYIDGREFDLSRAAFAEIVPLSRGITKVDWWVEEEAHQNLFICYLEGGELYGRGLSGCCDYVK